MIILLGQPVSYKLIFSGTTCILQDLCETKFYTKKVLFPQQNLFITNLEKKAILIQFIICTENKKIHLIFLLFTYSPLLIDDVILEEICK